MQPCATLELGPYRDGELDDPELDAAFDFEVVRPLPVSEIARVHFNPLSVGDAEPLHVALAKPGALTLTGKLIKAMGVAEVDGGDRPSRIGRRLMQRFRRSFRRARQSVRGGALSAAADDASSVPRCGASAWVDTPALREFTLDPAAGGAVEVRRETPDGERPCMNLAEFEELVGERAERAYSELGVTRSTWWSSTGPPSATTVVSRCSAAIGRQTPMGCRPSRRRSASFTEPSSTSGPTRADFDVGAEVETTIRHELEHHLAHLAGTDPVDDQERAEIEAEVARRVGRSETKRRALRAARSDLRGFFASTWAIWALLLLATVFVFFVQR